MGQRYSLDLRKRIALRAQKGRTRSSTAEHLALSPSCVVKLLQSVEQTDALHRLDSHIEAGPHKTGIYARESLRQVT